MRRFFEASLLLALCAGLGSMAATTLSCAVGLLNETDAWCGAGYIWIIAVPLAIGVAWLAGAVLLWPFAKMKLNAWWHYVIAGLAVASPIWLLLAQPFTSVRWQQSGVYDSLNYLGTGAIAALLFWLLNVRGRRGAA
jgi:hypothetical protein